MRVLFAAIVSVGWVLALAISPAVFALDADDGGTFLALDQQGQPIEKILRVSREGMNWKFEDRQPDGSWLDVTCHGGCQHHEATADDLVRIFGSDPPSHLKPDCIYNNEYAFCHILYAEPATPERYALIVKLEERWLPFNLVRVPEDGHPAAPQRELESALLR
ncbi:MAG: hypothetical protein ACT4QA_21315 [Panacagrimonas sp.]